MRPFMLSPLLLVAHALAVAPPAPIQGDTVCYSEQAILEHAETYPHSAFGWSVAIDGDTALVGDVTMDYDGAAYVFVRNGTTWTRQAKLQGWDNGYASDFGVSVALQGDIAVVGDWTGGDNWYGAPGLAYVFTRSGTTWTPTSKLEASDGIEDDYFGVSVAISGDTIAVGADYANAVYVFVWNGLTWTEMAKLEIPPTNTPLFGHSVALNAFPGGSTLIIGAPGWGPTGAGRAYAYVGNGSNWALEEEFVGTGPWPSRGFGGRVALSGDTALIGAGNFDSGGGVTSGAVFVYTRSAGAWALEETIVPPDGAAGDRFGQAVAIEGNLAVIGAPEKDEAINNRGVTYLYSRVGSSWKLEPSLVPSGDPTALRRFGKSVALSGQTIVDGAPGYAQYEETVRVFVPKPRVGVSYCTCSVAHCGNPDPRAGCANSSGVGASLAAQGVAANGDIDLLVEGAIPDQFALFFEAENAIHAPFGDGYLCAYGNLIRFTKIPVQIDWDGTAEFGPCFGWPTIPELTGVVPGSGVTKRYQVWYRDPSGPCGTGSNTTNALSISW